MVRALVIVLASTSAACSQHDPRAIECVRDSVCDRFAGGLCTLHEPTGHYWCTYTDFTCDSKRRWSDLDVGDGLAGACVAVALDAGADTTLPVDAGVEADAAPLVLPPITNYQSATLVLGQPDYVTSTPNYGGQSASSMYNPSSIAVAGSWFYVADQQNARVLGFDAAPATIQQAADIVVGQIDFTSEDIGPSQSVLTGSNDMGLCTDGTRLIISDANRNRVLIWNTLPTEHGTPADLVLGHTNFTSLSYGETAGELHRPGPCWTDGERLVVVDINNHRVLLWNKFPTANGEAADLVLGWPAFGLGAPDTVADPPTTSSMYQPRGVFFDGTRLYVSDFANHRVMVWNGMPEANGEPADYFLGQHNGTSNLPNVNGGGVNATGLELPTGIMVAYGSLFIADNGNNRVVVHTPVPTSSGEEADAVLGQPSLTANISAVATQQSLYMPNGLAVNGEDLWVADLAHRRVLRFTLDP
jgi:hypothetical protein